MDDQQTDDIGFDLDSALDSVSEGLNLGGNTKQNGDDDYNNVSDVDEQEDTPPTEEIDETPEVPAEETPVVETKPAPSSWAKDKHEAWAKMPPEAQDYYLLREKQMLDGLEQYKGDAGLGKQIKDVFTPYKPFLNAQGIDEVKASQYLMNAHYKLSTAAPSEKKAYLSQLAKSYGIEVDAQEQGNTDPGYAALQDKVHQLESMLTQRTQQEAETQRVKVAKDVEAFAADPAHLYFDEVADDIVILLNGGATLQDAYDKAVWANPITRAKELARVQTEHEAKLKEKNGKEVAAAKKATVTNVRNRETAKAPTGQKLGTMEDTMKETLAKIKAGEL